VSMILYQLRDRLREEGQPATRGQIHYALLSGAVDKPEQDCLGSYLFEEKHVQQMLAYLRTPKTKGRKPRKQLQAN